MTTNTVALFDNTDHAEKAISEIRNLGIEDANISYVYTSGGETVIEEGGGHPVGKGAASGAGTGAVLGGIAGLAVAAGVLPGLGALFVAGPLATALGLSGAAATTAAGALTGAAAGGLIGALAALGVSDEEAKIYEERVRLGDVLLTISSDKPEDVKAILMKHGAEEIKEYK